MSADCLLSLSERLSVCEREPLGCGSCCLIVLFNAGFNLLSLAEIIVGVAYKDECPLQPMIPTYLIGKH